jgi:hypothetical protein
MQSYTIPLNAVLHDFTSESDADWYHKHNQRCFVGLIGTRNYLAQSVELPARH